MNVDLKRKNRNRATKKAQDRKNKVGILVGVQKVMLQPKHMTSTTGSQTCLLCERLCRWKQRIHACFTLNIHHGSQTWPVHKSLLWLMWSIHCEFRLDSTLKPETEAPNCDNLEWKRVYGFPCYLIAKCHQWWKVSITTQIFTQGVPTYLEQREMDGLKQESPITSLWTT